MKRTILCVSVLALTTLAFVASVFSADRVILVGDRLASAPAQMNESQLARIGEELQSVDVEFVPLGSAQATVKSWKETIDKIAQEGAQLSEEEARIKEELAKGADAIVVMLGANDVRMPSIQTDMRFLGRPWAMQDANYKYDRTLAAREPGIVEWREEFLALFEGLRQASPSAKQIVAVYPPQGRTLRKERQINEIIRALFDEAKVPAFEIERLVASHFDAAKYVEAEPTPDAVNERAAKLFAGAILFLLEDREDQSSVGVAAQMSYMNPNKEELKRVMELIYELQQTPKETSEPDEPPADNRAQKYYREQVVSAFPSFTEPGFWLRVEGRDGFRAPYPGPTNPKLPVDQARLANAKKRRIFALTRGLEGTANLKLQSMHTGTIFEGDNAPEFEVTVPEGATYLGYGIKNEFDPGIPLEIVAPDELLPLEVKVKYGDIERSIVIPASHKIPTEPTYYVSPGHRFRGSKKYNDFNDFPVEEALGAIDYYAIRGKDPTQQSLFSPVYGVRLAWANGYAPDDDPNAIDLTAFDPSNAYTGAYVVRYFDSEEAREGTLKIAAKEGTTAIERVYFNGKQVYFGELAGSDPDRRETSAPVKIKPGRNLLVARVDRALWDCVVSFELQ